MRAVAKLAGVSSATVSRVVNGSPIVREKTAERVRRVIKDLNFIPNPVATTLKYGRSNTYGIIIPDLTNPFYSEFLLDFEEVLLEKGQELLLANTQSSERKLVSSIRRMIMRQVDGVVLMVSEFDSRSIEPLLHRNIPVVAIDRGRAQEGSGDVAIDFEDGYRQVIAHLKGLGHSRIGFIGGNAGIRTSQVRLDAFRKAVSGAGLTFDPSFVRYGDYSVAGGEAAMRSLLEQTRIPTAVAAVNDLAAFGVLSALYAKGKRVPGDMSVVGFDGILLSNAMHPGLTTVHVRGRELAQACMRALDHSKVNIAHRGLLLSVGCSIQIRRSTATPPISRGRRGSK